MRTLDASPRDVTLYQNGQHVSLDRVGLSLLGDLTAQRLETADDPRHGYVTEWTQQSLLSTEDDRRIPNAGCIPLLRQRAHERDVDLHLLRTSPISRLPEPSNIADLAFPQLARFVREHERGTIQVSSRTAPEDVISDLLMAYPNQRIIVLGKDVRQLKRVYTQLATKVEGIQCVTGSTPVVVDDDDDMPRVVVTTFMQAAEVDFATSDIVLLLDAYDGTQQRAQLALSQMDARFRLFGLVQASRTPAPFEEDMAMAVFGPEVMDIFGVRRSWREVNVVMVDNYHQKVSLAETDHHFWPQCYWSNDRRNRRIRQLGSALALGTPLKPEQFGEAAEWQQSRDFQPQVVTILVERPAHAVELSKRLPDWKVVVGDAYLGGCPGSFRNRIKRQQKQWDTGQRQIVLAGAAKQFRAEASDFVIWAGGGPHTDAIPASWLSAADDSNKPLLIVDFFDRHNRTARKWSRDRKRTYHGRDIFPLGISRTQGRIAMFLSSQPVGSET